MDISPPAPLDAEAEFGVLVLCAFLSCLDRSGRLDGPARHSLLRALLSLGSSAEDDLRAWMNACFGRSFSPNSWDFCRNLANRWRIEGIKAADAGVLDAGDKDPCPSVLIYKGDLHRSLPRLAVFNSRKPLAVLPDAGWIEALRYFLKAVRQERIAYVSSSGTLTYDLVAAHAARERLPLIMAAPFFLLGPPPPNNELYRAACGTFSCLPANNCCPKARKLVCRDRILAAVSQVHLVLEIRAGGNLFEVLSERQKKTPRVQFVFDPVKKNSSNAGNYVLLERFRAYSRKFTPATAQAASAAPRGAGPGREGGTKTGVHGPRGIEWDKFLYHYTRGCPGPWPGQSQMESLRALLDNDSLCGHSALDTLVRIISERRVRSGSGMVRGREPVVSWSSLPPSGFRALRRWNRSLVRWTVEPYGIAVSRDFLRELGAKPAIYGRDSTYALLPEHEKFRFQLKSSAGAAAWKTEREWRSRGDLELDRIADNAWFAFVPGGGEKERVIDFAGPGVSVIAFEEMSFKL